MFRKGLFKIGAGQEGADESALQNGDEVIQTLGPGTRTHPTLDCADSTKCTYQEHKNSGQRHWGSPQRVVREGDQGDSTLIEALLL